MNQPRPLVEAGLLLFQIPPQRRTTNPKLLSVLRLVILILLHGHLDNRTCDGQPSIRNPLLTVPHTSIFLPSE